MSKFLSFDSGLGALSYAFHCPGCNSSHVVRYYGGSFQWVISGVEKDAPTVAPSILVNGNKRNPNEPVCHSYVKEGKIIYLSDCTHAMVGQTVELPDIEMTESYKYYRMNIKQKDEQ